MSGQRDHRTRRSSFEDRMATVEFRVGERAHIMVDGDVCRRCTTKACVTACPANLFVPDRRRRHPVQLRAVLRVRHLLPWCATARAPSRGPTPTAGTASSSGRGDPMAVSVPLVVALLRHTDLRPEVDPLSWTGQPRLPVSRSQPGRACSARDCPADRRGLGRTGACRDRRSGVGGGDPARGTRGRRVGAASSVAQPAVRPTRMPGSSTWRMTDARWRRRWLRRSARWASRIWFSAATARQTGARAPYRRTSPTSSAPPRRSGWFRCRWRGPGCVRYGDSMVDVARCCGCHDRLSVRWRQPGCGYVARRCRRSWRRGGPRSRSSRRHQWSAPRR